MEERFRSDSLIFTDNGNELANAKLRDVENEYEKDKNMTPPADFQL